MTEPLLLILLVLILGVSLVYVIKQVSDYYVGRYHFSIWAGVLLMTIAFLALGLVSGARERFTAYFLTILASGLLLFTLVQDIRLASFGMGLLAFILQFFLTISLIAIALVVFARWIMNRVLGKRSLSINPGLAIGLNTGDPFRLFFTVSRGKA